MGDVNMAINSDVLQNIKKATGKSDAEIVSDALSLLQWAVKETTENRVVLSSDSAGENINQPILNTLKAAESTD